MDKLSLFTPFSSKWALPTRVLSTQVIEGSKRYIIDYLISNVHRGKLGVTMADDGMSLCVKVTFADVCLESDRIHQEFDIQGGGVRDAIMTAHDQSLDLIIQQHGNLPIPYNDAHIIHLLFHCKQSYTKIYSG